MIWCIRTLTKLSVIHPKPAEVEHVEQERTFVSPSEFDEGEVALPMAVGDDLVEGAIGAEDLLDITRITVVTRPASVDDADVLVWHAQDLVGAHDHLAQLCDFRLDDLESVGQAALEHEVAHQFGESSEFLSGVSEIPLLRGIGRASGFFDLVSARQACRRLLL